MFFGTLNNLQTVRKPKKFRFSTEISLFLHMLLLIAYVITLYDSNDRIFPGGYKKEVSFYFANKKTTPSFCSVYLLLVFTGGIIIVVFVILTNLQDLPMPMRW